MESEQDVRLSALSPRYPALYDEASGVFFHLGRAEVTVEQALKLAERPFVDGIEIGRFDEDGRTVDAVPAKKWANARRRDGEDGEPSPENEGGNEAEPVPDVNQQEPPVEAADKKTRSK